MTTFMRAPECRAVPIPREVPWLLVWDATKSEAPPPALVQWMVARAKVAELPRLFVEAPFKYTPRKTMKLGYLLLPADPIDRGGP